MEFAHVSVMFDEVISSVATKKNGIYADGTLGGGGHTGGILTACDEATVVGIDRDTDALTAAKKKLHSFGSRFLPVHGNFSDVKRIMAELGIQGIDGGVLDLGVSSYQLDEASRGFSYIHNAPLDMRMNRMDSLSAAEVINTYSAEKLTEIFYSYGEEKWSKRIAEFICQRRLEKPFETTGELVEIIEKAIPKAARADGGHPAKRVFQAVRIEVNGELRILENAIRDFAELLSPGGRLGIITFHSLEDRIVKNTFKDLCTDCICPKEFPVCVCNHRAVAKPFTKKPILPSKKELEENSRSRSAKLRVIEKL